MAAVWWTQWSESFSLGLSGAVGKTQSGGGETLSPRTVALGLSFKQSTRSALYLDRPQTPNHSVQTGA